MGPELIRLVAARFRALSDPARLQLLNVLRDGEATVSDLVEATGLGQANVSKHLALLHQLGFVRRRREGIYIWYQLADRDVLRLCDLMCGRIEAEAAARGRLFSG
ncbi:MAG TPA: metalloregulator ArsR/SmtB family transcription factor [Gemmatimonadaceae bacterium]|nr:metalloregulator ArsR/SmtB family transcription factor [Gemmatimonadaceae bacterium]